MSIEETQKLLDQFEQEIFKKIDQNAVPKNRWAINMLVLVVNVLTICAFFIGGILFVTDIKEASAIQGQVNNAQDARLDGFEKRLDNSEESLQRMETQLESKIESLRQDQNKRFDKTDNKLDRTNDMLYRLIERGSIH